MIIKCKYCLELIIKKPNESFDQFYKKKFCNKKCYGMWKSKNPKPITYIKKKCPVCLNYFEVPLSNKTKKTCSNKCHSRFMSTARKGELNNFYGKKHSTETRKKLAEKTFKHSDFAKQKMSVSRKGKKFTYQHRKNLSNSLSKGSVSKKDRYEIRKSFEYKYWREQVFKRDGWTCMCCGNKGCYLEAHHIKKFSDYKELRFDVNNGLTLCKKCHKKETAKQMKGNQNGSKKTK